MSYAQVVPFIFAQQVTLHQKLRGLLDQFHALCVAMALFPLSN